MITLISGYQGDLKTFRRYNTGLLNALKLKPTKGYHPKDKAIDIYLIQKGDDIFEPKGKNTEMYERYKHLFSKVFGKEYLKALKLHKLATLNSNQIISLFHANDLSSQSFKVEILQSQYDFLIDKFFRSDLELDDESVEWIIAITKVSLGNIEGFKYLCKQYNIPNSKSNIYKAICTHDYEEMETLFRAVNDFVPFYFCFRLAKVLSGEIDELKNMLSEFIAGGSEEIKDYISKILDLLQGHEMTLDHFKNVFEKIGVDPSIAAIVYGFDALMRGNTTDVMELFKYEQFKSMINDEEMLQAVMKLANGGVSFDDISTTVEQIIRIKTLFPNTDVKRKIEEFSEGIEMTLLKYISMAVSDGNLFGLARILDYMYFNNRSAICTLLASFAKGYSAVGSIGDIEGEDVLKKLFKQDMKAIIKFLLSQVTQDQKLTEFIEEFNIPYLIFTLMCPNEYMLENMFEFQDVLSFLGQENLEVLGYVFLLSQNDDFVPDFQRLFEVISRNLKGKHKAIKMNEDGRFMASIDNFHFKFGKATKKILNVFDDVESKILAQYPDFVEADDWEDANLKEKFNYEVTETGIIIDVPILLKTLLEAGYENEVSAQNIIELILPLFREIPGAVPTVKILLSAGKGKKDELLKQTYQIIKLAVINLLHNKLQPKDLDKIPTEKDVEEALESLGISGEMLQATIECINVCLLLMNKNLVDINISDFSDICKKFCNAIKAYQSLLPEDRQIIPDITAQVDFLLFIVGICKGEFHLSETIAQRFGFFDYEKIKELIAIINRFADLIFSGELTGLPSLTYIKDKLNSEAGKELRNKVVGAVKEQAFSAIGNAVGVDQKQITQAANFVSDLTNKSLTDIIVGLVFKKFDEDESGYIDYNEFCELCKFLGLHMDKEKSLDLFAQADDNGNNQISPTEFKEAMELLKREICNETLKGLGLTIEDLIWFGVLALLFLLQLFVLIFLGIQAFSQTSDFNSVINSILPLVAGLLASSNNVDIKEYVDKVKGFVQGIFEKIKEVKG